MFTIFAGLNLKIAAMTGKKYKIGLVGVVRGLADDLPVPLLPLPLDLLNR